MIEPDTDFIFVVWNSKKKRILMCTFNEDLARKLTEHYVDGVECSAIPVYKDLEEYLDERVEDIAESAKLKLTPIEYEAIKRTVEEEYPEHSEFDHEARVLYD